jgi:O-antigen ligase
MNFYSDAGPASRNSSLRLQPHTKVTSNSKLTESHGTESVVSKHTFLSPFGIATALVMIICYWCIDHDWGRSGHFGDLESELYAGTDNETADRLAAVNPLSSIARLALAGWGIICLYTSKRTQIRWNSPVLWTTAALLIMLTCSIVWSVAPSQTVFKLTVLAAVLLASLGIGARFELSEIYSMVVCCCLFFIGIGFVSEMFSGTLRLGGDYRFVGTCHPNTQAIYAAFLCMISRQYIKGIDRANLLGLCLLVIGFAVLALTKSRTTLAGAIAGMVAIQIVSARGANRIPLVAIIFLLTGMLLIGSNLLSQQATELLGQTATMGRSEDVSSLTGRLPLWEELLVWIDKRPVYGYGYLAFWTAERVEDLSETFKWEIPHGHNMFLDTMLDVGWIGVTILVLMLVAMLIEPTYLYSKTGNFSYAILTGIIVSVIVNGCAESLFKLPGFPMFVVTTFCISMIFDNLDAETQKSSSTDLQRNLNRVNLNPPSL